MSRRIALVLFFLAPALAAQSPRSISPGMRRAEVVAALGDPVAARAVGDEEYLFYANRCGERCGMNDLVVLHRDSVVDAIFRDPGRRYTGTSSSPHPIPPAVARRGRGARRPASAPRSGAPESDRTTPAPNPRMRPGPPNDVRPSIPLGTPPLRPAPAPMPKKSP